MRAVIASAPPATSSQRNPRQESWAVALPTDSFAALFRGELVVSHNEVNGSDWRVCSEPANKIAGVDVSVLMNSYEAMLVRASEPSLGNRRSEVAVMIGFDTSSGGAEPAPIPSDPRPVLDRLVPDPESGIILMVRCTGSTPEHLPEATRVFLRRASLERSLQPNNTWGPGVVWGRLLRNGVHHLRAQSVALTAFDDACLPRRQSVYGPDALAESTGPEVTDLPRQLWELHNGEPNLTHRLQTVRDEFARLAPGWEFAAAGSLGPSVRPTEPVPLQLAAEAGSGALSGYANPRHSVFALPVGSESERLDLDITF